MAPNITKSSKPPVRLEHRQVNEFAFKSSLKGPIAELSILRRSLLFAEISMASYMSIEQCNLAAGKLGFTDGKLFRGSCVEAHWFQNEFDSVMVFRGTEVNHWNDIAAYANAPMVFAETVGKVHRVFKTEVDKIWPIIEKDLEKNQKTLWFCGHSLGAAIATICASRCMLSYLKTEPEGLFTFGSPRVGNQRYVNHVKLTHYRWVNKNDVVTRLPPPRLGYRHAGIEMSVDQLGRLKDMQSWRRISDRLKGVVPGVRRLKIEQLSDHLAPAYIDAIFKIVRSRENNPNRRFAKPGATGLVASNKSAGVVTAPPNEHSNAAQSKSKKSA